MEAESMQMTIDLPDDLQLTETDLPTELALKFRMVRTKQG
jgi:hypothetical protein